MNPILALRPDDKQSTPLYLQLARKLEAARELAKADPQAVANIIKDWMGANG